MPGPFLDPSVLLLDPQFTATIQVTQRVQQTNDFGEMTFLPTVTPSVLAVVTPTTPADLLRLPESQRGDRHFTVFSQFRLNGPAVGRQPDLVQYLGDSFVVKMLLPWTAYGPGWTKAIIGSIDSVEATT
jgi:hypothetical protein